MRIRLLKLNFFFLLAVFGATLSFAAECSRQSLLNAAQGSAIRELALNQEQICERTIDEFGYEAYLKDPTFFQEVSVPATCLWQEIQGAGVSTLEASKFFGVGSPKFFWGMAKRAIHVPLGSVSAVSSFARYPIEHIETLVEETKLRAEEARAVLEFTETLTEWVSEEIRYNYQRFQCLPPEVQREKICHFFGSVGAMLVGPGEAFQLARSIPRLRGLFQETVQAAVSVGRGISAVSREAVWSSRVAAESEEQGLSFLERMRRLDQALKNSSGFVPVRRIGERSQLFKKVINGEEVFFVKEATGGEVTLRELIVDAKTGKFSMAGETGSHLIRRVISDSLKNYSAASPGGLILIDLNHLGKVNYFSEGLKAGDDYLRGIGDAVSEAISQSLRVGDRTDNLVSFRFGGDELAIVASEMSADEIAGFTQRINEAVIESPAVQAAFQAEKNALARELETLRRSGGSEEDIARLTEKVVAMGDFHGSVSIGSTAFTPGDGLEEVIVRANVPLERAKIEYKIGLGEDVSKYTLNSSEVPFKEVSRQTFTDRIVITGEDGRVITLRRSPSGRMMPPIYPPQ